MSRRAYLAAGVALFALKYPGDLVISRLHHHPWNPLMYVSPRVGPFGDARGQVAYVAELLLWALPFIWAGVSLTARRLRDAGVHPFWAGLFFLPYLHFALFAALVVAPPASEPTPAPPGETGPYRERQGPLLAIRDPAGLIGRVIPRSTSLAYLFALGTSVGIGMLCYVVTVQVSSALGALLFIGLPFGTGFWVAFCMSYRGSAMGVGSAMGYAATVIAVSVLLLLGIGFEGAACVVMAAPLVFGAAVLGAWFGWMCARSASLNRLAPLLVVLAPFLIGAGWLGPGEPQTFQVVSRVTLHATPAATWNRVVSFPAIDAQPSPVFALVAMPLRATIDGRGAGATRRCVFTNGEFVEPIRVWDEPRELTFGVASQPPGLEDYIRVEAGQFLLRPGAGGNTELVGTTWYQLRVSPSAYFNLWARLFLHAIHERVLEHIQQLAEHPALGAAASSAIPTAMPSWMASSNATCRCTQHSSP